MQLCCAYAWFNQMVLWGFNNKSSTEATKLMMAQLFEMDNELKTAEN